MRTDWLTKSLLAVIAAGLWLLALTPEGAPATAAAQGGRSASLSEMGHKTSGRLVAGSATLPVQWQVPFAMLDIASADTHCNTPILVTNPTSSTIEVDIEYYESNAGTSLGHFPVTLAAGMVLTYWPHHEPSTGPFLHVDPKPFLSQVIAAVGTDHFRGRATVHANDPRIITTAFTVCRSGLDVEQGAKIVGMTTVPTYAVQGSLTHYRAAGPVGQPPTQVVAPESR